MKKEIDAIRVKDISQGGLTQGQQTQIARNEQRMSQVLIFRTPMVFDLFGRSNSFFWLFTRVIVMCYTPQIMEELESLEETLNESIQESLGARSGKITHNRKLGIFEEEDDILRLLFIFDIYASLEFFFGLIV